MLFVGIGGSLRRGGGENHEPDKQGEQSAEERQVLHLPVGKLRLFFGQKWMTVSCGTGLLGNCFWGEGR